MGLTNAQQSRPEPMVSVIVPVYNGEQWIHQCLESIRAQTFTDYEIIVVDDGSTDNTPQLLAEQGTEIRSFRTENRGVSAARNKGIREARGKYVAFLDADDLWEPDRLERQIAALEAPGAPAWIYSDALAVAGDSGEPLYRIGQRVKMFEGNILRPLLLNDFIPILTVLARKDIFNEVGLFDENMPPSEDWDLFLRIASIYPIAFIPECLARYRIHPSNNSRKQAPDVRAERQLQILDRAFASNPHIEPATRRRAVAAVWLRTATFLLQGGERVHARSFLLRAARQYPFDLRPLGYWVTTFVPDGLFQRLLSLRRTVTTRIYRPPTVAPRRLH